MLPWIIALVAFAAWAIAWWWGLRFQNINAEKAKETAAAHEIATRGFTEAAILDSMQRHPKSAIPVRAWVDFAFDNHGAEEALRRARVAAGMFPKNPNITALLAKALVRLKQLDEAEPLLRREVKRHPDSLGLWQEWIECARQRNQPEEALARCAEARRRVPAAPIGYAGAATVLLNLRRLEEAEAMMEEGRRRLGEDWDASYWDMRASVAQQRGDPTRAAECWEKAVQAAPRMKFRYVRLSKALHDLGRGEEARPYLAAALLKFPDDPELLKEMARLPPPPAPEAPPAPGTPPAASAEPLPAGAASRTTAGA